MGLENRAGLPYIFSRNDGLILALHRLAAFCLLVFLSVFLNACSSGNYAPVYDVYGGKSSSRGISSKSIHVVAKGDTLFSIAWRYGWDYRALARVNKISSPYTIYPGQKIRVDGKSSISSAGSRSSSASSARQSSTSNRVTRTQSSSSNTSTSSGSTAAMKWRWPTSGDVVTRFSSSGVGKKGISIAGKGGQQIYAAESGVVVYQGNGLTGYGNLIIIKHNDRWLSAYAHNDKMFVKEGSVVKAGEKLATMGSTGADRTGLHFEIRHDGKPVDPLRYLPKR
jgi:lipoprotein NlpD